MSGSELGEFALIERIVARLGESAAQNILVPSGDDAAAWAVERGTLVATTDAFVEGTHWRRDTMSFADVGWRVIAANVSDIAAMGATPQQALVALVIPPSISLEDLDEIIDGIAEACLYHELHVAGGDIVRGNEATFTVTVFGSAPQEDERTQLLRRDSAQAGDTVGVSGTPGASAAGLALIESNVHRGMANVLVAAHRRPIARVALGRAAVEAGITCAIDLSDGLMQDLGHIAQRSVTGIEIDLSTLPLAPAAIELMGEQRAIDLALGGGEDFELAFVASAGDLDTISTSTLPVTAIGRVVAEHPGETWAFNAEGKRYEPPSTGWDHLRTQSQS